jgi:hypothetical protein
MAIRFVCPACHKSVRASDECGGLNGPCPACKATILIPRAGAVPSGGKSSGNGHEKNGLNHEKSAPPDAIKVDSNANLKPAEAKPVGEEAGADASPAFHAGGGGEFAHGPAQYLKFRCPGCERLLGFPAAQAGQPAVCPKCQTRVMVPEKDGGESFIVGALAEAHKGLPISNPAATPVVRFHRLRRTARRLRVVVRRLPWWQTVLIIMGCTAALAFSGYIIVSEFSKEWEARERARQQPVTPDVSAKPSPRAASRDARSVKLEPGAATTPLPVGGKPAVPAGSEGGAGESILIGARGGGAEANQPFDPTRLFKLDNNMPSPKAADESEPVPVPLPERSSLPPPPKSAIADAPADSVLSLLEKNTGKGEEQKQAPEEAPVGPDVAPEIVGPVPVKPPENVMPVDPPAVCADCQGTSYIPFSVYKPYVWDYKEPAPDPLSSVPYVPCPKCQRQVDPRAFAVAEAERMKTAPSCINEWTRKLNARVECGETRYVSVIAQLSSPVLKNILQQMDKLTQHLQTNFRSVLLTQTRPDTHQLIIVWDRPDYERLIDVLAAENPEQDWALTRRATGSMARERCFFSAQRGLGSPSENMAIFQFAHMLILEGTAGKSPDWLTEGFASYCENVVLKKNLCYAFRYAANQVRLGTNWNAEVAQSARQGQMSSWDRIFKLELIGMKPQDYLMCYSVVRFLASDPVRFRTLLVDIRAGVASQRAVEHAYGRTIEDLRKMWTQWAARQK